MGNSPSIIAESMKGVVINNQQFVDVDEARFFCYNSTKRAHIVSAAEEESFKSNIAKLSQTQLKTLDYMFSITAGEEGEFVNFDGYAFWPADEDLTIKAKSRFEAA